MTPGENESKSSCKLACKRIFDAEDRCCNRGFYLAALKGQVTVNHFTVDELQSLTIAQRLCADDFAVFKGDILTVPG